MDLIELFDLLICRPDGGQAGRLCSHNVNADTEVRAQLLHARSDELHDFIIDIAVFKYRSDDRKRNILRTYTLHRLAVQIDGDHARHLDVICLVEKLLYKLRSALAHGHSSERAVTRMAVRSEDHLAAAGQHLTGILVDDCLMRRNIDAAVFLRAGQSEHVVILIDRTADRAEAVVSYRRPRRGCCGSSSARRGLGISEALKHALSE